MNYNQVNKNNFFDNEDDARCYITVNYETYIKELSYEGTFLIYKTSIFINKNHFHIYGEEFLENYSFKETNDIIYIPDVEILKYDN